MLIQFVGTREQREMGTLFICSYWKCRQVSQVSQAAHHSRKWKKLTDHIIHTEFIQLERWSKSQWSIYGVHLEDRRIISHEICDSITLQRFKKKRSHLLSYVKIKIKVVTEILMMWSLAPKKILDRKPFWAPTRLCQHTSCWTGCKLEVGEFSPLFHYMVY